ncbi:hypothetical protein K439DRAFT_1619051 [Ramaria rubella]|nr:hypothetical protein K439DRAFT_1619051 [Ramaria rubella]
MAFTCKATGEITTFKLCGYIARKELPSIYANTKWNFGALPKEIDPLGRLAKLDENMHYNEENRVAYLKKTYMLELFQTGTLVEVTFMVTTKLRKNTWKVYHDLNEIVLLNDNMVKWYQAWKLDEIVKLPLQLSSVSSKREHGEAHREDHEIRQACKKLKELDISMVDGTQCSPEGDTC